MVLEKPGQPLQLREVPKPRPGRGQLLVRVATCAVCRTDLHVVDGELPDPKLPLIPGHQIVGHVEAVGMQALGAAEGGGEGLQGDPDDVVLRLLGGEGAAARLGVEPQ